MYIPTSNLAKTIASKYIYNSFKSYLKIQITSYTQTTTRCVTSKKNNSDVISTAVE